MESGYTLNEIMVFAPLIGDLVNLADFSDARVGHCGMRAVQEFQAASILLGMLTCFPPVHPCQTLMWGDHPSP